MIVPKIVWPSAGANELLFAFPPVGVRPFDRAARRHDTIASSGKRQSLLERTDKFLELDLTLVPTEAEQYLEESEQFDAAAWVKTQTGTPGVPVVTPNVSSPLDPLGGTTADQIVFPATGAGELTFIQQDAFSRLPETGGRTVVASMFLRASAVGNIILGIAHGGGNQEILLTLSDIRWQRFSILNALPSAATLARVELFLRQNSPTITVFAWGAMLGYDVLGPYIETEGAIPAAIDRWDTFITAVLDGTNFDYYPDAFAAGFTTYVLEDKAWRPKLQVRGANRFYEFKLRLREFV